TYFDYEKVKGANIILDYFRSSNVSPILVDEMAHNFFSSSTPYLGERLVKSISNECSGCHPVLIGTTNARDFSMTSQMVRRIYYLQVSNTFEDLTGSKKHLNEIYSQVDSLLFRDFSYRMAEMIKSGNSFYTVEDPLFAARGVFQQYYRECGLKLPAYFPQKIFDDYNVRGRFIWAELFKRKRESFDLQSNNNNIFVDIDQFSASPKDRNNKINMLSPNCIVEDSNILVLNKTAFLDYIGSVEGKDGSVFRRLIKWITK
ncbi:MAG: hypothetical protein ACYC21_08985, partial [Eubacteriales bacterium]